MLAEASPYGSLRRGGTSVVHSAAMRWSTVLGVLAGLLVVVGSIGAFIASLPAPPQAAAPTPVAVGGSVSLPPTASPAPTSSVVPSASTLPTGSAAGGSPTPEVTPLPTPGESTDVGLAVGDTAPPLELEGLGGPDAAIDTKLLRGKPVWVNFMATYCPPCVDELPILQRVQDEQGESIAVLLVDVGEDEDTVQTFVDELNVTLPVGLDRDGRAVSDWRALALPIHLWLDGDGKIRAVVYGGGGPDILQEGLKTVLPEATIRP